jgi:hypothetical protein
MHFDFLQLHYFGIFDLFACIGYISSSASLSTFSKSSGYKREKINE